MSDKDWNKLTVAQLKEECTQKGLTTTGKKSDLVSRLQQHEKEASTEAQESELLGAEDSGEAEPVDDKILNEDEPTNEDAPANGTEAEAEAEVAEGDDAEGDEEAEGEGEDEGDDDEDKKPDIHAKGEESDKKDTKTIPLPDGVPELPSYQAIQEARIAETRMRTVIVYPMNIEDMSNPELQEMLSKSQHFMVKFVQDVEKKKKGFVEMHFNTRKDAREAAGVLREIKLSVGEHTVRQLEPDEAGTAYKSAVIDTIKPHLTHQIKKATDDYDTRVVYVHNLPENTTDEQLAEIFPEAKAILTAIDEDEKNKGYAYLSFETEEESEECIKKHEELKIDESRVTLHMIRDLKSAAGIEARKPFRRMRRGRGGFQSSGPKRGQGPKGGHQNRRGGRSGMHDRRPGRNMGGSGGPRSPRGGRDVRPLMGAPMPRPLMGGGGNPRGYGGFQDNYGRMGGGDRMRNQRQWGGRMGKNPLSSGMNYIDFGMNQGGRKRKSDGGYGGQSWKMPRQMGWGQGGGGGWGGHGGRW